jgi:hypothetical protein
LNCIHVLTKNVLLLATARAAGRSGGVWDPGFQSSLQAVNVTSVYVFQFQLSAAQGKPGQFDGKTLQGLASGTSNANILASSRIIRRRVATSIERNPMVRQRRGS